LIYSFPARGEVDMDLCKRLYAVNPGVFRGKPDIRYAHVVDYVCHTTANSLLPFYIASRETI